MIVAKKFSTLAMAVALTLSVPALSGCESTTSNSQTTGRSQLMLVSSEKVMQDAEKAYDQVLGTSLTPRKLTLGAWLVARSLYIQL